MEAAQLSIVWFVIYKGLNLNDLAELVIKKQAIY